MWQGTGLTDGNKPLHIFGQRWPPQSLPHKKQVLATPGWRKKRDADKITGLGKVADWAQPDSQEDRKKQKVLPGELLPPLALSQSYTPNLVAGGRMKSGVARLSGGSNCLHSPSALWYLELGLYERVKRKRLKKEGQSSPPGIQSLGCLQVF